MAKLTFKVMAIALTVSLVALVSFGAGASGRSDSGEADAYGDDSGTSLVQRVHALGARLHGHGGGHGHHAEGSGFMHEMAQLVNRLDLSPQQAARLDTIHEAFATLGSGSHGSIIELHDELVEQFERGDIEAGAIQPMIDRHLAEIRSVAYSVTDELVDLVNSLDAGQREIVLAHLQEARSDRARHGH